MAIDTLHPDYPRAAVAWEKCRHASEGQQAIHEQGEKYLPKLMEQDAHEYHAYRDRALFYNGSGRTIDGLTGMVFRRPPKFEIPADLAYLETDVDTGGTPLVAFCEKAVEDLVTVGRMGLLADFPPMPEVGTLADEKQTGARPYLQIIKAEAVTNWRCERINNRQQLSLVVIKEPFATPQDEFTDDIEDQYRVLRLFNGAYQIEIWRQPEDAKKGEWTLFQTMTPTRNGSPLDFIPFLFCGQMGVSADIGKPPIIDLVNVNLSHYKTTADYEHGLHFTGLPTPIVTGHTFEPGQKLALGSTEAHGFPDPAARAFFLEFSGGGLAHLATRLNEKEQMMAALGARMLGAQRRAAETAETAAIHRSGENAVLASLAIAAGQALGTALTWCAQWAGSAETITVELNTDYLPAGMAAQDLTALVQALQAGAISHETFYDNLARGEIAQQGVDFEDEMARIQSAGPPLGTIGITAHDVTGDGGALPFEGQQAPAAQ